MIIQEIKHTTELAICNPLQDCMFKYYSYNNFHYDTNQGECELGDGFIIFEDNILIFETKSANENEYSKKDFKYDECFNKLKKQLHGRKNKIEDISITNLSELGLYQKDGNNQKMTTSINYEKNANTQYFYIACIDDVIEKQNTIVDNIYHEITDTTIEVDKKDYYIDKLDYFLFDGNQHFFKTLKYCNTILDFVNYLKFSKYIKKNNYVMNNDQCLALFLHLGRIPFDEFLTKIKISVIFDNKAIVGDGDNYFSHRLDDLDCNEMVKDLEKEEESIKKIDEDIIKNGIYKDVSKNEQEQEEFCRYFAALDRWNRKQHVEQINTILNDKDKISPCGYVYDEVVGNAIGFLYLNPNYKFVDQKTFEGKYNDFNTIQRFIKNDLSTDTQNIEKFIVVNYTSKTFDVVTKTLPEPESIDEHYKSKH